MSLERALLDLEQVKADAAIDVVFGQVEAQGVRDLITDDEEYKYPVFVGIVDEIRARLEEQAGNGYVDPEIAAALGRGVTILAECLIQYAETETFGQHFPVV